MFRELCLSVGPENNNRQSGIASDFFIKSHNRSTGYMAKETAIVTDLSGDYAMVKTQRTSGCAACSERNLCNTMGGGKDMEFLAINPVKARLGDTVLLDFKTSRLLQLSLLLYIFPIIVLLIGALVGESIVAPAYGIDRSAGAAGTGFAAFIVSIVILLLLERRAKKTDKYKPVILTVKKPGTAPSSPEECDHKEKLREKS